MVSNCVLLERGMVVNKVQNLSIEVLDVKSHVVEADIERMLEEQRHNFQRKIIVLDDDPTGTQTVHGVYVYTKWTEDTILEAFKAEGVLFYILTNSRSFSEERTRSVHKEIAENIVRVSKRTGIDFLIISRGDSTLRGHYPLETQVLKEAVEKQSEIRYDGEILCPFFKEGGRFTLQDIHYVQEGVELIPAGLTEFAGDKTFGYQSSNLRDYVAEKSCGAYHKDSCISITLEELRAGKVEEITHKLLQVSDFQKVIVNAIGYIDLKVFAVAWMQVMRAGKNFLARSAAGIPKVIGGITDKPLLSKKEVKRLDQSMGGLIIIGSHVKKTTMQFQALQSLKDNLTFIEFHVEVCKEEGSFALEVERILDSLNNLLKAGVSVVIYTSRKLTQAASKGKEDNLALSVSISEALTEIVKKLSVRPSFLIAKGGITSSDIATKGLAIRKALVLGQIKPGIPVWLTQEDSTFPQMPYIIFPGNVGHVDTLKEIVEELCGEDER